ncbi:hypothetical protein M0R45_015671 [Rubus argutus]|uniref:Pectate lyase domain-containing protein n=1 Tax=Rubus argutus TaxID=59490 RepID=A0AAW1XRH1_RUBAR
MASLPYADVDSNLRAMAGRAEGFGRFSIGGLLGPVYSVTTLADDGPAHFMKDAENKNHLDCLEVSGTINLSSYLSVSFIRQLMAEGIEHIWIDRCSLRDYDDGLIDITRQSTDITISRCYFQQHDKTMLIGADPSHVESQIYSQCNIYEAGTKKKAFEYYTEKAADREEAKSGFIRSEGDIFLNGAQPRTLTGFSEECMFHPSWQSIHRPPVEQAVIV